MSNLGKNHLKFWEKSKMKQKRRGGGGGGRWGVYKLLISYHPPICHAVTFHIKGFLTCVTATAQHYATDDAGYTALVCYYPYILIVFMPGQRNFTGPHTDVILWTS